MALIVLLREPAHQGHAVAKDYIEVSADPISAVTGAVLEEVAVWQTRPLEAVYPLVFLGALRVKIRDESLVRNKAIHIAPACGCTAPRRCLACGLSRTRARNSGCGS